MIDVHAHIQLGEHLRLLTAHGVPPMRLPASMAPIGDSPADLGIRLRLMDEAGVAMQMLLPTV